MCISVGLYTVPTKLQNKQTAKHFDWRKKFWFVFNSTSLFHKRTRRQYTCTLLSSFFLYCLIVVFRPLSTFHAVFEVESKVIVSFFFGHVWCGFAQAIARQPPYGPQHNSTFILEQGKKAPSTQAQILLVFRFFFSFKVYGTLLVGMSDNAALNHQPFSKLWMIKKKIINESEREWSKRRKKKTEEETFFLGEEANNKLKRSGFVIDFVFNGEWRHQ